MVFLLWHGHQQALFRAGLLLTIFFTFVVTVFFRRVREGLVTLAVDGVAFAIQRYQDRDTI